MDGDAEADAAALAAAADGAVDGAAGAGVAGLYVHGWAAAGGAHATTVVATMPAPVMVAARRNPRRERGPAGVMVSSASGAEEADDEGMVSVTVTLRASGMVPIRLGRPRLASTAHRAPGGGSDRARSSRRRARPGSARWPS